MPKMLQLLMPLDQAQTHAVLTHTPHDQLPEAFVQADRPYLIALDRTEARDLFNLLAITQEALPDDPSGQSQMVIAHFRQTIRRWQRTRWHVDKALRAVRARHQGRAIDVFGAGPQFGEDVHP